ncbi:MAG: TolC family protein, partial [Vicinamibacterales bacterium]
MSYVLRSIVVIATALLIPAAANARQEPQTSSPPDVARRYVDPAAGTSLADLIALGLRQEPGIQAALLATTAARHQVQQAGLRANPSVSVERQRMRGGMGQWAAMANWPLELFRRGARVSTAEAEVEMTAAGVAEQQRMLTLAIEMQYGELLMAVRDLVLLDELWTAARETVTLLGERAEAGAAPRVERDAAAVDAGRLEARRALATGQADAALLELKRLVGLQPS